MSTLPRPTNKAIKSWRLRTIEREQKELEQRLKVIKREMRAVREQI